MAIRMEAAFLLLLLLLYLYYYKQYYIAIYRVGQKNHTLYSCPYLCCPYVC